MSNVPEQILSILEDKCYERYKTTNSTVVTDNRTMCLPIFDGLYCWPYTKAGELAVQPCSNDVLKSTQQGHASKQCTENGTWLIHEDFQTYWSNLTECGSYYIETFIPDEEMPNIHPIYEEWLPIIKNITYLGYSVSILALLVSVSILIKIKRLHCTRNRLHINLFFSFIMKMFMSVVKDGLFVGGTALFFDVSYNECGMPNFSKDRNYSWLCKTIVAVEWYFVLSNFNFMLMEGIYLYNLMFSNFLSEQNKVTIYCVIGWGLPMVFVISWATLRIIYEDIFCWTTNENKYINLFIDVPIGLSVIINFVLFLIIVRVLTIKLNNTLQQKKRKFKKLLKATLILIPLFGIPYSLSLLLSFITYNSPILEIIWLVFDQTVSAFQGLFASLLYCLLNNEVQLEVKRKYLSLKDRNDKEFRRSRTISNTQQFSMQTNDEENDDKQHFEGYAYSNGDNIHHF